MAMDMTLYSIQTARPAIRPVSANADRTGFGPRFSLQGGSGGAQPATTPAPPAPSGLGDTGGASDFARLARRYETAAQSAVRRARSDPAFIPVPLRRA